MTRMGSYTQNKIRKHGLGCVHALRVNCAAFDFDKNILVSLLSVVSFIIVIIIYSIVYF